MNSTELNKNMIETQIRARGIRSEPVIQAMLSVERHRFIPGLQNIEEAYADHPLPIGQNQTISQPFMVALMSAALEPSSDLTVLEIGTGCGYQTAILAKLFRFVYSVEIIESLAKLAASNLEKHNIRNVKVIHADGNLGYEKYAPFSRILAAASPDDIPEAVENQLETDGIAVIPVGSLNQELLKIRKNKDGKTSNKKIADVRFVPMTNKLR